LFEKLDLPVVKKTKTGFSTNEEVLRVLAEEHQVPILVLEYRQLAKLKSTYIDALPNLIDSKTERVHTNFVQTGAETGRLSSKSPNLQNIPIRTELGQKIRSAFIPGKKDWELVSADYSQIELRILAHLSKDEGLIKAFKEDQDIHTFTAQQIFDVSESDLTKEMRTMAKRVNFGIVYGISAFGLAKDLKVVQSEAQEFIDRYFARYPLVREFMDSEIKNCERRGYVVTLLNRRRYLPEILSKNNAIKNFAQRQAINTPVQGTAADLMKLAMINVHREMTAKEMKAKMLITVHDEIVLETPSSECEDLVKLLKENMENAMELSVPIKVSVKVGKNWLDMKDM
ncbi:DNA polymerase I, partial [hydrothermal vent metagenome]